MANRNAWIHPTITPELQHLSPRRKYLIGVSGGRDSVALLHFLQAAGFQWVNPKGWFMALTAITVYAPSESMLAILTVAAIFSTINLPSILIWTYLGQSLRRFLTSHNRLKMFNWTMAALLIASLAMIFQPVSGQ